MWRRKKPKERKPSRLARWWAGLDGQFRRAVWRNLCWIAATAILAAGAVAGMKAMERRVLQSASAAPPVAVRVALVDYPDWMPPSLVRQIAASMLPPHASFHDAALTSRVFTRASASPWVREATRVVKRMQDSAGVIEICASYRKPLAKVRAGDRYEFVDRDGVRLPADEAPQWISLDSARTAVFIDRSEAPPDRQVARIHYVVIDGVDLAACPVPEVGRQWAAGDLRQGLKLVELVCSRPYANQVTAVDVRNHAGRISRREPYLRMYAQVGAGRATDIRFGRFPVPDGADYVVSPERKMSYLDAYVAEHNGRLAGLNSYLDLRHDELHVSIN